MKLRLSIIYIIILILSGGCNEDPYLDIPEPDDLIVIDGWIETGCFAQVLLTRNSAYFSAIDSATMRTFVLTRAKVTISDGDKSEVLILRKDTSYFPPYIFEGNEILGQVGKSYKITAEYGGKAASAVTTIPEKVPLDTSYFIMKQDCDTLASVYIEFTDPLYVKNYYRILTKRIGIDKRYFSTMIMCLDDLFFSGETFGFSLKRGPETLISSSGNEYFSLGDTISIKFCTIDEEHYNFWNSFQDETFNAVNPFAASLTDIESNIEGDGLGIWGGYGTYYDTVIIK
jgi:hypothetical protein